MPEFLKVEEVLSKLHLRENMLAAEFGCGSALFALSLARKIKRGRVYALDIQEEKLKILKGRADREKINNIIDIVCDLEVPRGSRLSDNFLDIVLIPNVLFQAENKYAIIEEAHRVLKKGGELLIIDWLRASKFAPVKTFVNPDEVKRIAEKLGLTLKNEFAAGDYHYGLLFVK